MVRLRSEFIESYTSDELEDPDLIVKLDDVQPPVYSNRPIGSVRLGDQTTDLVPDSIITAPDLGWKIQNLPALEWQQKEKI
ncbi:MAG: hypothetical protein LBL84_02295 [Candidatus Nomurabacteria bacterium]|jgi:hypothetical protein|nr:hypothetical protein [Candidatus Nomurabacteria bacterium]